MGTDVKRAGQTGSGTLAVAPEIEGVYEKGETCKDY